MRISIILSVLLVMTIALSGLTIGLPIVGATESGKCGIDVPSGSAVLAPNVVEFPDGTVHTYSGKGCPNSPTINGWIEFTSGSNGQGFTLLSDYWNVPNAPSNTNDPLIYFFDGVQPTGNTWIIQPILAWGCQSYTWWGTCSRGGHNWWITAAYVPNIGQPTYSNLITVYPGDQIYGRILWLGSGCNGNGGGGPGYEVSAQDVTRNSVTYVYLCNITTGPNGFPGVLEAYRINYCSQLPNVSSETFYSISSGPAVTWGGGWNSLSPSCNYNVTPGTSSVTLFWNPNA